jgi:hypothetical protein
MQSLYDAVYDWLIKVHPGLKWIRAEQTTIPPTPENENFGIFRIISNVRQGYDSAHMQYLQLEDKFDETVYSVRDITLSLDVFSVDNSAEDILNKALVSLVSQEIKDIFYRAGFGILMYSDLRNLSAVISSRFNSRFQVDISIGANLNYTSRIDRVVTVPYSGDINNETITGEVSS